MSKIPQIIKALHEALKSEPGHLAVLYQVQGNLADSEGERVFATTMERSMANKKLEDVREEHPNCVGLRVVVTVAE